MDKIVVWVDDEMQKIISDEFRNSEIILVRSLFDFTKNVDDDSLNKISASNFDDFDTSGFIYEVRDFFRSKENYRFHIFMNMEKDNAGLSTGVLRQEKNANVYMIFRDYTGTLKARIDAGI